MHRARILALVALVAALSAAVLWQVGREARGDWDTAEALFPGLDASRVTRIRIENAERMFTIELVRDPQRGWTMVHPIEFPAEPGLPTYLLQAAEQNRLEPVAREERNAAALGLDPPRATIRLFEALGDGERVHEVELGALDADRQRIGARAHGALGRTQRNLLTTIDRSLLDFRDPRVLPDLEPRNVVEVHRSGLFTYAGGEETDLALDALFDTGLWHMSAPWTARMDAGGVGFLIATAAELQALDFVDDGRAPEALGLDRPWVRLELVSVSGRKDALEIGFGEGGWYARRDGAPWVWRIGEGPVIAFAAPPGVWVDDRLVRATRADLAGLRLLRDGRELLLERDGERWTVVERSIDGDAEDPGGRVRAADPRAVADLLGALEGARYERVAFDLDVATIGAQRGFDLLLVHEVQGARFGAPVTPDGGSERLVPCVRSGETVAGWVDPALADALAVELESVLSKDLLAGVEEFRTTRLVVEGLGRRRAFERDGTGTWREEGHDRAARELEAVLDPIFFLRAERHLTGAPDALAEPITVSIEHDAGTARFTIGGIGSAPAAFEVEVDGRRALPARPDLWQLLAELLRG